MITLERHEGILAYYLVGNARMLVIYAYIEGNLRSYYEKSLLDFSRQGVVTACFS